MKKFILLLSMFFTISWTFGQNEKETANPSRDMEIVRKIAEIDIEGKIYKDVVIFFKSGSIYSNKVKIKITNRNNEVVYKKTFKNSCLYIFSTGQIQVGRKNFNQIIVSKSLFTDDYFGKIREKEGIY